MAAVSATPENSFKCLIIGVISGSAENISSSSRLLFDHPPDNAPLDPGWFSKAQLLKGRVISISESTGVTLQIKEHIRPHTHTICFNYSYNVRASRQNRITPLFAFRRGTLSEHTGSPFGKFHSRPVVWGCPPSSSLWQYASASVRLKCHFSRYTILSQ